MNLATILTEKWPEQFDILRSRLSPWMLIMVLSAYRHRPEERMQYQEAALRDIMESSFRELDLLDTIPGMGAADRRIPAMLSRPWPKDKPFWKHAYRGSCQDLTFITTLDRAETYVPIVFQVASEYQYPTADIGGYIQPLQDGHACQVQFNFYFDPEDEDEKQKVKTLYLDAAAALMDRKAYFNRPYPLIADMVYRKHGEYAALLKRFKKHFDPNYILSPGNLCF